MTSILVIFSSSHVGCDFNFEYDEWTKLVIKCSLQKLILKYASVTIRVQITESIFE